MKPAVTIEGGTAVLALEGQFTFDGHREFKEAAYPLIDNPAIKQITLDMAQVTFMDSSSLGILLLLKEKAEPKGKQITLRNPNPTVLRILEVVHFGQLFQIHSR
jgi:anti-anti-sigma factor